MVQPAREGRPLPWPNPTTQPFFDAAREGRLELQECPRDGFFFYPRSRCPACLGDDWRWQTVSGRGEVYAFTIDRIGHTPGLAEQVPYAIACVELEEGPRMTARILDCDVDQVSVGMPVEVCFEDTGDISIPAFPGP